MEDQIVNGAVNRAVRGAVIRTVYQAIAERGTVTRAVNDAVYLAVFDAVGWDVDRAMYRAMCETGTPHTTSFHPGLEIHLNGVG